MLRWTSSKSTDLGELDPQGRRILGFLPGTDEPVWAPSGHSSVFGANGSGKSTRVAAPAIFSYASTSLTQPVLVCDVKDGELAAQFVPMLYEMGIPVSVIDDFETRPELAEHRVSVNGFGAMVAAYLDDKRDLIFGVQTVTEALIPEPPNDARNTYFRAWPKKIIAFASGVFLKRNPERCTPGGTAALLYDPEMLISLAEIELEEGKRAERDGEGAEGNPLLQAQAKALLDMRDHEHWGQHLEAAQRALELYAPGTRLSEAGADPDFTHADLIRRGGFVFLVGPMRYMERCSTYMGTHLMSFVDALYAGAGSLKILADEWTNFPAAKELITRSTTMRAYGGELLMISQSPSEVVRKFGE